jgi:hypothetical protein
LTASKPGANIATKEVMLTKLNDYSGEFLPNLKLSDFSPDTLAELLKLYARLYIAMDGIWYLTLKQRVGDEEALACDIQVWELNCKYEMARIKRQLKIRGNDIVALMKAFQLCPWCLLMKFDIEVRHKNSALYTVTYCPTLDALEQEGLGREAEICNLVEPRIMKAYASAINPDIEVKCLKSPPRKSKDEICCQWEFSLTAD